MKRLISVLLSLMLISGMALADEHELIVNGVGRVYMEADLASAVLGLTITGEDLAQMQQQANETVAAVCEALKQAGLEEKNISTNYIYMYPRYDYSSETERIVGYSINNTLTITTDEIDRIGAYIDAAFAAGANTFDSISFSAKDDRAARKQALELAVSDARMKAEVIAAASGKMLGDVVEIREGAGTDTAYMNASGSVAYGKAEAALDAVGTTVRAAQVEVCAGVEITYELK